MRLTQKELQTLSDIADAAAQEVMDVYDGEVEAWLKDDASPLTEADLRADRVIRRSLEAAFPGVFILSEESRSPARAGSVPDLFFLVDPLDGTKEFLKRNGEFTVNIALVRDGRAVAGVVCAPALGEAFHAAQGLGAWKRTPGGVGPISVSAWTEGQPLRVIGSRSHGGEALQAWLGGLPVEHRFVAAGSSLKFCRIAEGAADLYPRFGPTSQWDTAAAQCVLEQAGGAVIDAAGQALRYGLDRPLLNPEFFALGEPRLSGFCCQAESQ